MDGCKSVIFDEMKRIFPILIFLISACSHSREVCDTYSAESGSVSDQDGAQSYRSVSSPDFSDSVRVSDVSMPAVEQVKVGSLNPTVNKKNAAVYKTESFTRQDSMNQQVQINSISSQLASLNSSNALQRTQRNLSPQDQTKMDKDVQLLGQLAPESFEYNLYAYILGNYDVSRISFLKKAAQLQPTNEDVIIQYAAYHVSLGEIENAIKYLDQWERSLSSDFSNVIYAKDVMNSVDENGLLVVHGINDSYSVLLQQLKNKLRPDVQIVSLELLQSEQYKKLMKDKGLKFPESELIDKSYLEEFCKLNKEKNPFLSMTIPREYLIGMTSKLFAVGLTFEYSEQADLDNFYRNEFLWNSKLTKDLIKEFEKKEIEINQENQLVSNYLPMLLQMRQVYIQNNELDRKQEIDFVLDKIGHATGKKDLIDKIKLVQQ
jgi:tetratricopeptide (TPR) repeat protein